MGYPKMEIPLKWMIGGTPNSGSHHIIYIYIYVFIFGILSADMFGDMLRISSWAFAHQKLGFPMIQSANILVVLLSTIGDINMFIFRHIQLGHPELK